MQGMPLSSSFSRPGGCLRRPVRCSDRRKGGCGRLKAQEALLRQVQIVHVRDRFALLGAMQLLQRGRRLLKTLETFRRCFCSTHSIDSVGTVEELVLRRTWLLPVLSSEGTRHELRYIGNLEVPVFNQSRAWLKENILTQISVSLSQLYGGRAAAAAMAMASHFFFFCPPPQHWFNHRRVKLFFVPTSKIMITATSSSIVCSFTMRGCVVIAFCSW